MRPPTRRGLLLLFLPVLALNAACALGIHRLSARREVIKEDYSQVNSIRFGLLSVDSWTERIQVILADRIGDFELSKAQEAVLRAEISKALNAMIGEADRGLRARHSTFSGKMRKLAIRAFVSIHDVRKRVPAFTQAIIDELKSTTHKRKLKKIAQGGLDDFASQTYDSPADTAYYRATLARHGASSLAEFNRIGPHRIRALESDINGCGVLLLDSALVFLLAWWLLRRRPELHRLLFSLSVAYGLILLVVGLASPMIDLDARIKSVDFLLWGEHLTFHDQVLFYRSKSILQVVQVLMATGKADSLVVGALILLFSVVFPLCKLGAMEAYGRGGRAMRDSGLVRFFAFKSGKWSMADVTVVAVFIAYIGFKGILDTQLAGLNVKAAYVEIIATNDTALQPGFVLFTAFVLFGFALSAILEATTKPAVPG